MDKHTNLKGMVSRMDKLTNLKGMVSRYKNPGMVSRKQHGQTY